MDDISVLVCDDSALMRNLISRIIEGTAGLAIAGKAMNGQMALEKITAVKPDVIILDIEMPVMNGIEFLKERKTRHIDVPVIILSSIATQGAAVTMEALELGASDFITKPNGSVSADLSSVSEHLVELISSYGGTYARRHGKIPYPVDYFNQQMKMNLAEHFVAEKKGATVAPAAKTGALKRQPFVWKEHESKTPQVITPKRKGGRIEIIAIGISTGGPNALRCVFKLLDPHLQQPILVVQHMPAGFTKEFAGSLDRICPLTVKEAEDGEEIKKAYIYIAPGNYHIYVEERTLGNVIRLSDAPQRNGHRPSADVLFESVAKVYQNRALGVIMTGMGRDGAVELTEMRKEGAWTLGQDQSSSVVYGMPRAAWEMGAVQKQVELMKMADAISSLSREHLRT